MRVAIVSDYLLDYVGGAQTSMLQQRAALEDAGHDVLMVAASRAVRGALRESGAEVHVRPAFTLPGVLLPVVPNTRALRERLREVFQRHAIEAVHVQSEFGLAHAAADVAAQIGVPTVHTVHTFYWASEGRWHAPLAPLLRSLLARFTGARIPRLELSERGGVDSLLRNVTLAMALRADSVVSPSAHQAWDLELAGVNGPIAVVPNPIATSPVPSRDLSPAAAQHPDFLWVARCEAVKRPLVFAQAAVDALAAAPGTFTVTFVGDGSELSALRRLVAGRPEITVHGALPQDRVQSLMDSSAMVVLTSLGFDNQPMTIAEAVTRQRGVLYCDPKLSEGLQHSGYLARTPDAAGLAEALTALSRDPEQILRLSRGTLDDRQLFEPANFVATITALYSG